MRNALIRFRAVNAALAMRLGVMMSWPEWVPLIVFGSLIGWYFRWTDVLMLLLTIQTSADAAATKMLQNHVREEDERRDKNHEAILLELRRLARRASKNDRAILDAFAMHNELMEAVLERGLKPRATAKKRNARRETRQGT